MKPGRAARAYPQRPPTPQEQPETAFTPSWDGKEPGSCPELPLKPPGKR